MNLNLFTSRNNYKKNKKQSEIDYCHEHNRNLPLDLFFTYEGQTPPTYSEFFQKMNEYPNDINILCSPDVIIDERFLLQLLKFYANANDELRNTCMFLSSWIKDSDEGISQPLNVRNQDVWVFYGRVKFDRTIDDINMSDENASLRLLSELIFKFDHKVINPCEDFKTYSFYQLDRNEEIIVEPEVIKSPTISNNDTIELNVIITCYDKEDYIPHLVEILNSYKKIKVNYVICYNGLKDDFDCHFKINYEPNGGRGNDGHPHGCPYAEADLDLLLGGYEYLKSNGVNLWVKLSADSWMADEDKILQILEEVDKTECSYAGNFWYEYKNMATDIFFSSTKTNNIFEDFKKNKTEFFDYLYQVKSNQGLEMYVGFLSRVYDRLIIHDREPMKADSTRWGVKSLGWTMSHAIDNNINFVKNYISDGQKIRFNLEKGHGVPFVLEHNKVHI
jgi:hypothetical protein